MRTGLQLMGIGWYVALCIVGGGLAGVWMDDRLGLGSPVFSMLGLVGGIGVAVYGMYRMLMAVLSAEPDSSDQTKG
jgi:cytochrome b561